MRAKAAAAAGVALAALAAGFVVHGRRGAPGWRRLPGTLYAHRGLHGPGVPENSLPAFRAAAAAGYGAELDVHLTADGRLVVFHDGDLTRMCGVEGTVEAFPPLFSGSCGWRELRRPSPFWRR